MSLDCSLIHGDEGSLRGKETGPGRGGSEGCSECVDISELLMAFGAHGCSSDNHDIISMKLFQLMVEHPVEDETVDWTKIEPSVSLLKSPKGELVGFGNLPWGIGMSGLDSGRR